MNTFQGEKILTIAQLAKLTRVNISTAHRWHTDGVRGVKLAGYRVGTRLFTSWEAYQRWQDRVSATAR
jgi:hypothetical protein